MHVNFEVVSGDSRGTSYARWMASRVYCPAIDALPSMSCISP